MPDSLINQAFDLLGQAKALEDEVGSSDQPPPQNQNQEQQSSWVVLEQSASKYNEACFLMKNHIRSSSSQSGNPDEAAKMKRLLATKIDQYETHADELMMRVKDLKLADEQQQQHQQQQNHERVNKSNSNSSWEASHGSHLLSADGGSSRNENKARQISAGHANKCEVEATKYADKANRLLGTALDHDERGESSDAINLYLQAVQWYSHAVKLLSTGQSEQRGGTITPSGESPLQQSSTVHKEMVSLQRKQQLAMDRVRKLKHIMLDDPVEPSAPPQAIVNQVPKANSNTNQPDKLTPYEIKVLKWSSEIASGVFLPWSDEEASEFNRSPTRSWLDPKENKLLPLSDKQIQRGCQWSRPPDIAAMRRISSSKVVMIQTITPYTIKQHCVSDCSFIAGLCISAAFERRFHRPLVSSLIYPQDPVTGMPTYNPHGVYMVKLWLNGVARRVIIDDLLPVDKRGNLLCSHTTNLAKSCKDVLELWVPILEKAYMKLCGGYNFPGSNSGVDLFCLTGWIPERIFFPEDPAKVRDFETPVERAWERLYNANSYGDCLITVSTSKELTEEQAEKVGLFTGHAYAVLGVVQTSNGTRLLQLKNPWASQGWKGRFSPHDQESWSDPSFCAEVGYDAKTASHHDDGVFWMAWEDLVLYFRNIHMSWNTDPALFRYRSTVHGYWPKDMGPNDDSYNVGENPQYTVSLSQKAIKSNATLWILLSRHVTKQEQEGGEVDDYLTLHIHRIKNARQVVWYPTSQCILTGAYTNNQHVLVRYDATGPEDQHLSLVLSQYKKSHDLGYTLSCYCTEEFAFSHPEPALPKCQKIGGSWKLRDNTPGSRFSLEIGSAGGPPGKGSFGSNPQWSIRVPVEGAKVQVKCMAPKELPINVILARSKLIGNQQGDARELTGKRIHHLYEDPVIDTGDYRHGFAVSDTVFLRGDTLYTLVASTFTPGAEGKFILHFLSSKEVFINEIDS